MYYSYDSGKSRYSNRQLVTITSFGVDGDVRAYFLSLDAQTLDRVLNLYGQKFGEGKRKYAEKAYQGWRTGQVKMSGEVSSRLLSFLPSTLDMVDRYELFRRIWLRFSPQKRITFTITENDNLNYIAQVVDQQLKLLLVHRIPDHVTKRLVWLSDGNSLAAESLLKEVLIKELQQLASSVMLEARDILQKLQVAHDIDIKGERHINLGNIHIAIKLRRENIFSMLRRAFWR